MLLARPHGQVLYDPLAGHRDRVTADLVFSPTWTSYLRRMERCSGILANRAGSGLGR
jgi:hypothetical protein